MKYQFNTPQKLLPWFSITHVVTIKIENIGNRRYIDTSILWVYQRNVVGYFDIYKISMDKKLTKTRKNVRKKLFKMKLNI